MQNFGLRTDMYTKKNVPSKVRGAGSGAGAPSALEAAALPADPPAFPAEQSRSQRHSRVDRTGDPAAPGGNRAREGQSCGSGWPGCRPHLGVERA